jgi:integrase
MGSVVPALSGWSATRRMRLAAVVGDQSLGVAVTPICRLNPERVNLFPWTLPLLYRRLKLPKGASLHSLRHSHCSHRLALGVPLPTVPARLGHGSIWTTQEIYSHMIHGQDDEASRKWEEFQNRTTARHDHPVIQE